MADIQYVVGGPCVEKGHYLKRGYHPDYEKFMIESASIVEQKNKVYIFLNALVPESVDTGKRQAFYVNFSMFIHHDRSKMGRTGLLEFMPVSYEAENVPAGYKSMGFCKELKLGLSERRHGKLYSILLEVYGIKMNKEYITFYINDLGERVKL